MSETKKALADVEALREKVAALEAAVRAAYSYCAHGGQDADADYLATQILGPALSGGTAALEAHDAALLARVRARVEALKTPGRRSISASDGSVAYRADIDDVLAALVAKGG